MEYFIIILHFVVDWILQPRAIAKNKTRSWKWMAKHLIIIHVGFAAFAYFVGVSQWIIVLNTVTHGIIDKAVWTAFRRTRGPFTKVYMKHNLYAEDYWFYFTIAIDQILHLLILFYIFKS